MRISETRRAETRLAGPSLIVCMSLVAGGCVGNIQGDRPGSGNRGGDGTGIGGSSDTGSGGQVGAGGEGIDSGSGGSLGSGSGGSAGSGGAPMMTGMRSTPGDLPLPRLSRDEYIQTVRDLVNQVLASADATQVLGTVIPLTTDMPADELVTTSTEKHGGFARDDQSEQQQYSDTPVAVAAALGMAFTNSAARISAVFGSCAKAGAVDATCLKTFIKAFGSIALRHPLSDDDVTFYAMTAKANPPSTADLAQVIAVMLASPRFLYRVESGDQTVDAKARIYRLDAWELASRLSYHFWGTMPDAALRADADSGAILTDAGYSSTVDRLMKDPRADATLRTFFEQWLWPLIELPPLDSRVSDPVFKVFAGSDLPTSKLRERMINDVLDATSWVTSHNGGLSDLLTNKLSFARDADLAAIYGVSAWNGQGTPPTLPNSRVGLLARAAFLATGTINTRPIMKGIFIRSTLLCDGVPPPPANAANTPLDLGPNQTTREVIETVTQTPGTVCLGCHRAFINPLGFASENFDGLGRERIEQTFYDASGKVTGKKAVDTTSIPAIVAGDSTASTGIGDVTQLILKTAKVQKCMARRIFRFAFRRIEGDVDIDTVNGLTELATNGKLSELFKGVALRPEFKQRVINP